MKNTVPEDRVRAALEGIASGKITQEELESMVRDALQRGLLTPVSAAMLLRDAAARRLVSLDMLARLGLGDAPPHEAPPESPTPAARAAGSSANLSNAETRLRSDEHPDRLGTGFQRADRGSAPPLEPPMGTGRVLGGRYVLERELGEGGMGIVYLAHDQEIQGETFAIKVLKPEIREHPEALALMREEVRKTRALQHPNIVGVYSLNGDGTDVYILMEYLEGKTLKALIDDDFGRGVPFDRAWPLIQDICAALAYAHDHSVIHSDLKPSNVFVTTSGKAKLLDFGIARAARGRAGRFDPAALGALTVGYASCEMFEGCEPDQRDDVYSLACVIYEMLSGRPPFDRMSALDARTNRAAVAPIRSLTRGQNAALAQALAFDRSKRTASVEALLSRLRPNRLSLPRNFGWIGACALVLLTVAGLTWFFLNADHTAAKSPTPPANSADSITQGRLRSVAGLVAKATALDVDPDDPNLQQAREELRTAREQLAVGPNAEGNRLLADSQAAIVRALQTGKRIARLGSHPNEIAQALVYCRQVRPECAQDEFSDETQRTVPIAPFEIDKTEVTNRAFSEFVDAKRYQTEAERGRGLYAHKDAKPLEPRSGESWKTLRESLTRLGIDAAEYPVRGIDFKSASDYCAWRNQRLPTEEEWEFAARGLDHRLFAWGNEPRMALSGTAAKVKPVNEQPITGLFGAAGLGDGLLEWVDGGKPNERLLRGSSWLDTNVADERLARRRLIDPSFALLDTGFRCAQSAERWPDQGLPGGS